MDYTQITSDDRQKALSAIGVDSVEALFKDVPAEHRVQGLLNLPPALSEPELIDDLEHLAGKNHNCSQVVCFLGAGAYDHFIPRVVEDLAMRGEFATAYTPYQAEASQGLLQAFFEYQTMICQLTGMDISNASLYEGATSVAEAVLMAGSITGRRRIIVSDTLHPDYRTVLEAYTQEMPIEIVPLANNDGRTALDDVKGLIDNDTAAVVVQSPNFLGVIEDLSSLAAEVHRAGALFIVSVDPISCGLLKSPGACGADIVVGEGQPLGIPMSYGGPFLGILACRKAYLRKVPGRLVGQAFDAQGRKGYCLALQVREQHIRRDRATSNVCTNQGLMAMRAAVYLAAMGKKGLRTVAEHCRNKAAYAADAIDRLVGFDLKFDAPFFKEFVVKTRFDVEDVLQRCRKNGVLAGVALEQWYPDLSNCFLVAVTEKRTKAQIDRLVELLGRM